MKLLVSVRNFAEAQLAASCGVDIVDLKEPDNGSLGAASPNVIRAVGSRLGHRCQLSLAMGELLDLPEHFDPATTKSVSGYTWAKIGLAGCSPIDDWQQRWQRWARTQRNCVASVAVAYADFQRSLAPHPREVVRLAITSSAAAFLIDTHRKDGSNLLDHWSVGELKQLVAPLKKANIAVAVAGSLDERAIASLLSLGPEIVAVRGAACDGGFRHGQLCPKRIEQLQDVLSRVCRATG